MAFCPRHGMFDDCADLAAFDRRKRESTIDPPDWCVVCDDVPKTPHVRDEGHPCRNPRVATPEVP